MILTQELYDARFNSILFSCW